MENRIIGSPLQAAPVQDLVAGGGVLGEDPVEEGELAGFQAVRIELVAGGEAGLGALGVGVAAGGVQAVVYCVFAHGGLGFVAGGLGVAGDAAAEGVVAAFQAALQEADAFFVVELAVGGNCGA
ncbi:MAG: hypothetical protein ACYS32_07570 [Planctomycetota bacterium]